MRGINRFLFGGSCDRCAKLGVSCRVSGLLTPTVPTDEIGQRVIYLNREPIFRKDESIENCVVFEGTDEEREAYVKRLKERLRESKSRITLGKFGNY